MFTPWPLMRLETTVFQSSLPKHFQLSNIILICNILPLNFLKSTGNCFISIIEDIIIENNMFSAKKKMFHVSQYCNLRYF